MDIETKNASLDTLAVTILALHVSGKQMTLAVFRQLPEGVEQKHSELWGTVRYAIKDSSDLWLVFSTNGRLFRRGLDVRRRQISLANFRVAESHLVDMRRQMEVLESGLALIERERADGTTRFSVYLPPEIRRALEIAGSREQLYLRDLDAVSMAINKAIRDMTETINKAISGLHSERDALKEKHDIEDARYESEKKRSELRQLFISV